MQDLPLTPKAARLARPGWLDGRLLLGILLVLVSVVVGARLLASADSSQSVWVATRDLAAGSTVSEGDLRSADVRLFGTAERYLAAAGTKPVGYVLARGIGVGELLPRQSLVRPDDTGARLRDVSVPVAAGHLPDDLRAGQQVDVYVTLGRGSSAGTGPTTGPTTAPTTAPSPGPSSASPAAPGAVTTLPQAGTRKVLSSLTVTARATAGGLASGSTQAVVLSVPDDRAADLVAAVQAGGIDLVRVPRAGELPALAAPSAVPSAAAPG